MNELLTQLQREKRVWNAASVKSSTAVTESYYPELDQLLQGGFPVHGVVDIHSPLASGELRLLLPCLRQHKAMLVYINPPGKICAEQLHHYGIRIDQVLVINTPTKQQGLWAAETCLKSGACGAVLLWQNQLQVHQIKRLQLASETGNCQFFWLRLSATDSISLPVTLGLSLQAKGDGVDVVIRKRKGGWPTGHAYVDMAPQWPALSRQITQQSADAVLLQAQGH